MPVITLELEDLSVHISLQVQTASFLTGINFSVNPEFAIIGFLRMTVSSYFINQW